MAVIVASQSYALGGHIVVVARSGLDFLLWILLCGIAASERVRTCRLFLVCGVLTEIASWTISYLIIPLAATESQEFFSSLGGRSILLSLFFLLAMLTLTFGALSLNREPVATSGTVADMKADRPDAPSSSVGTDSRSVRRRLRGSTVKAIASRKSQVGCSSQRERRKPTSRAFIGNLTSIAATSLSKLSCRARRADRSFACCRSIR